MTHSRAHIHSFSLVFIHGQGRAQGDSGLPHTRSLSVSLAHTHTHID